MTVSGQRAWSAVVVAIGFVAAALPLVGLVSLLLRSQLDPHFENYRAHFVVFGIVGAVAFTLGYTAGEAANRRGDARVLLLSVNTGARFESLAPVGGVLIGADTYGRLPDGAVVEERSGLRVKGKSDLVHAYVLLALP